MRTVTADLDPGRVARAAEALANGGVRMQPGEQPGSVVVGSFSGPDSYLVRLPERTCTCPDSRRRGGACKHVAAVLLAGGSE